MNTYSFCESVTGIGPWHIRQLSPAGKKTGGGIDSPSLCGRIYPSGATTPNAKGPPSLRRQALVCQSRTDTYLPSRAIRKSSATSGVMQ